MNIFMLLSGRVRRAAALAAMLACLAGCGGAGGAPVPTAAQPTETAQIPETDSERGEALPTFWDIMSPSERVWRYLDEPSQLAGITDGEWTAPDYDDSHWQEAAGSFGAKDGKLQKLSGDFRPTVCLRQYDSTGAAMPAYFSGFHSPLRRRI